MTWKKTFLIKINYFLLIAVISSFLMLSCKKNDETTQSKPNILFIAIDDLKPTLGAYGNTVVKSPNMDLLAKEGRVFSRHYVQVPTCGASRYSLLTGLRPTATKYLSNQIIVNELSGKPEADNPESFIHHLRRNGYYTVGLGKISHSADGLVYGYTDEPSTIKEMPYSWDEFLFDAGKWETGWNSFFGYANGENRQSLNRQVTPYEKADVADTGYPDGITANLAIEKLKTLKEQEQPFFLGVGFFKPHLPFNAPKKYWDLYDRDQIPSTAYPNLPENVNEKSLHGSGEFNGYLLTDEKASLKGSVSEGYSKKLIHAYYASVSYIDGQVGKVLDELKRLKLDKNTIVVVWGDHGWHLGDKRMWGKHTLFEEALKSSLIIKVPGMKQQNNTVESIVETVDIFPTLLELCEVPEMPQQIHGNSFTKLMSTSENSTEEVAYSYFKRGISIRTHKYRLTKYFREAAPQIELYDHENDPLESKNIASQNPDIVKQLLPLLNQGDYGIYNE